MNVAGRHYRTIWVKENEPGIEQLIDQRALPHRFVIEEVATVAQMATAIREMHVRGAPLIGAAAAYGMYLAMLAGIEPATAAKTLRETRPTAMNLSWAIERQLTQILMENNWKRKIAVSRETAEQLAEEDAEHCRQIGLHGLELIEKIAAQKTGKPVNLLTHCNAGWLACVDYGTATAPIYAAHDRGIIARSEQQTAVSRQMLAEPVNQVAFHAAIIVGQREPGTGERARVGLRWLLGARMLLLARFVRRVPCDCCLRWLGCSSSRASSSVKRPNQKPRKRLPIRRLPL